MSTMGGNLINVGISWSQIAWGCLTLFGIVIIIKGMVAETFTRQGLGRRLGQKRVTFRPKWYDRLVMVACGLFCALYSLRSLILSLRK